ncbi:hypothetical protein HK100_006267 [Physocladia obscura]|uniref:Uncharacterized protein n=1 Tax=Physocladia obscura TaxID=109957 RepID=A0AAD5XJ20_9FUNG|nr:hypothetical protein HK100_006267 [Physocladia obscura]
MTISSDRPLSMTYILAPPQPLPPSPLFKIPLAPAPRLPLPKPSTSSPRSPRKSHYHRLALSAFPHPDHEHHYRQQPERGFLLRRAAASFAPLQQQSPSVSARHHRSRMNCLKNCHRPSRADLLLPPQQLQQQSSTLPQQSQLHPAVLLPPSPVVLASCVVLSLRQRHVKGDGVVPMQLAPAPVSLVHMVT